MPLVDIRHPGFFDPNAKPTSTAKVDSKLGLVLSIVGRGIDYITDVLGKWTTNLLVAIIVGITCYHAGIANASVKEVKATADIKTPDPKAPAPTTTVP